ncbi:Protein kinase domain [Trypanosoma melophagium]|uniref:Protein kinase domain n=1 Tax=Trypanosoma melophagium TaxID=715481 RepID=UPI00351A4AF4|nr:Protein kinase domain [Trypanosoma melophagium]
MTYHRKSSIHLETGRPYTRSPSVDSSSPYSRTPLGREWARGSPTVPQYMPPPPIAGPTASTTTATSSSPRPLAHPHPHPNARPYANGVGVGVGAGAVANLNCAIPSSPSPLAEARYAAGVAGRPASANGGIPRQRPEFAPSPTTGSRQQRAASTVMAPPRQRPAYYDGCGIIVEERDPVTRDVVSRYRCGSLLGTGGFAQVFDFRDLSTGVYYAGKVIDKRTLTRRGSEAKFRMEVDIHSRVRHPNIIRFVKSFQDEYYHYIILEQCSKKSMMELSKERGTFTTEEMQYIMLQIVSAVEYMHNKLIIHRDLKLGNVMIDFSGNMKIGDFGFASELTSLSDKKTTTCGTPNYIAPEVLATEKTGLGYGLEADIWSLGVILYALAFGTPPFETKDINTTYNKIRRADYSFPPGKNVSESCKELIQWMLQREPQHRPTPSQVLNHNFFHSQQPLHIVPRSLVPPEAPRLTSPNERRSPLWASPVAAQSPFPHNERNSNDYRRSTSFKRYSRKGSEHELPMTLHEFLKENDCITETVSGALYSPSENKVPQPKPPAPSVMLQSSIYCNKYGYGFLSLQGGKWFPTVFLNDKTKLVFDVDSDTVFYYGRSRIQALSPESGNRSPLLSEELASKGFRDELIIFCNASTSLAHRTEGDEATSRSEAAAAKKLAITKFFLPFLEKGTKDKRMVAMTCTFKEWHCEWERDLFASSYPVDGKTDLVYVKDAVMETLHGLTGEYQGADMQLLVARMSDYSFQVSVRCQEVPQPLFCPRYSGLSESAVNWPWSLDILVYAGFRAVIAFETNRTCLVFSFLDIRQDARTTKEGRVYSASGSTSKIKSIMIPSPMLRVVTTLLRRVRCCTDIVDCFC